MKTLDQIAIECQTDKSSKHHGYCDIYDQYLSKWRDKPITLIEAGIGGYEYADRGGQSARMWREYFSIAEIVTFDIHRKFPINGVDVLQGAQDDPEFIGSLPPCDIFIDDASHINSKTIKTFQLSWSLVKPGGLYIIEDCHTSYWPEHGYGGHTNVYNGSDDTTMLFFLHLCHSLNKEHIRDMVVMPECLWKHNISFIHFYSKLIIVGKK